MFNVEQKRSISQAVQTILRATAHPELPEGEINFSLHVDGAESWSWADIVNNGRCPTPDVNPHNEQAGGLRVIAFTEEQYELLKDIWKEQELLDYDGEPYDRLHRALFPEWFED